MQTIVIPEALDDYIEVACAVYLQVESLTAARQAAAAGNEPADSIRAVNALLTQLDQLRVYPNVMVRRHRA